ncbi:hypothetical protein GWK41_06430 [Persephonella atlantica]|uniref:Uncharacterized protein n=1 Tax=Persephonella atlantica TaxID=2699429 RepID=A0ABS1GIM4_9AQUI|nr:hypothetical protein [Persephonella atlantica]MBK3332700.1 hypothetical protein [Persephonella atlantica]
MKRHFLALLSFVFVFSTAFSQEKLTVVYLYHKDSPHYEKINNKILKNKHLAKRIKKNFEFYKVMIGTHASKEFANRYNIEEKEGVYFIDPSSNTLLYRLTDLNKPCKCANLINYFSRKLYKKGISPDRYLEMAERIGAYQVKTKEDYLF